MAPTAPKKRTTMRAKVQKAQSASAALAPRKVHRAESAVTDRFLETKRDKKLIKKSALVAKVRASAEKFGSSTNTGAGIKKRRRPSKKLVTNLEALADALPELGGGDAEGDDEDEGRGDAGVEGRLLPSGKIRMKSMKSRPGALKRKAKLLRTETTNLQMNMAFLANLKDGAGTQNQEALSQAARPAGANAEGQAGTAAPPTANRWAALRAHISATMEQNPAFEGKS